MGLARLYVLLFVRMGVPFGVAIGLISGRVLDGALQGVIFGLVMSALFGTREVRAHRELGGPPSPRVSSVVEVPGDAPAVRDRALRALRDLRARIIADDDLHRLVARTPLTWRTWGTRITVDLRTVDGGTAATVRSHPRPPWAVIDAAEGRRAVGYVVAALRPDATAMPAGAGTTTTSATPTSAPRPPGCAPDAPAPTDPHPAP